MGKSKRMALMLPKGFVCENGEYEVEIPALEFSQEEETKKEETSQQL